MKNDNKKEFWSYIGKLDGIDIILKYKREISTIKRFFLYEKKYALDFCIVCNFSIQFIYIFINWPNFHHDTQIYVFINL